VGFDFGSNWERLVDRLTEEHVQSAVRDISGFLERDSLKGLSFLDVGCGSGLSSLAAYRMGASEIISVDLDPKNIRNLQLIREKFRVPETARWTAYPASILDTKLPQADIVYSWGVLHHTGKMWEGVRNCMSLVKPGGYLYLMLYRDSLLAATWKRIKYLHSISPKPIKSALEASYAALWISGLTIRGRNPVKFIRNYSRNARGMEFYLDAIDWVGGYPFEYASAQEVCSFVKGFELVRINPPAGGKPVGFIGVNHQYLFRRMA
jgi:2-polyprenyl-6-hydroxyphenyl methylase/3-demethylubiquinone-9 3-methyltransferase